MAQTSIAKLDDRSPFPTMEVDLVGGGRLRLPDDLQGKWAVILAYRGFF